MDGVRLFIEDNVLLLRRITQASSILAVMSLLLSGQVGVNFDSGSFTFFGNRIWPHEIALVLLGLALPFVLLAGVALALGRVFCGWACPQTALCELASATQRWAAGRWSRGGLRRIAAVFGAAGLALSVALAGGFTVVGLFLSPEVILGVFHGQFSTSLLKGITVASFLILVDVVLLRHTFCEWMCIVGWWQRLFSGRGALRVAFSVDRARECTNCTDCKKACFMRLDPRRRELPGTCLNCGKCIAACRLQMASASADGLIGFRLGGRPGAKGTRANWWTPAAVARMVGFMMLLLSITSLFSWSVMARDPVQIRVRQAQGSAVELVGDQAKGSYVIDVYSTTETSQLLRLSQSGLPEDGVVITPNPVVAAPHEHTRASLTFRVHPRKLHPGRNVFEVTAVNGSGHSVSDRVVFGLPIVSPSDAQHGLATRDSSDGQDPVTGQASSADLGYPAGVDDPASPMRDTISISIAEGSR